MEYMVAPKRFLPATTHLLAFEAVVRHGSITGAARELSLTQGAVSRQIQNLETQLGVSLFERRNKRVHPTSAGASYADEVRGALKQIANASLKVRANPDGGTFNLAILPSFGTHWLAPRLADFLANNAGITVQLSTRLSPFDFDYDNQDAAIHFGAANWPNAEHMKLMDEAVIAACSPRLLLDRTITSPADLGDLTLLHLETRADAWQQWFRAHDVSLAPTAGMMFDQFATMSKAAVHGAGVALLPRFLIENELADGSLVCAYGPEMLSLGSYFLTWPKHKADYQPLVRFKTWLKNQTNADDLT